MKTKVTQEKALRWAAQGLTLLVVLVAAVAVNLYFKIDELETSLSQARVESDKTNQAAAAARSGQAEDAARQDGTSTRRGPGGCRQRQSEQAGGARRGAHQPRRDRSDCPRTEQRGRARDAGPRARHRPGQL